MRTIKWQKCIGKGENRRVVGDLEISFPDVGERDCLPKGWSIAVIFALALRAAKVDAASKYMALLKANVSRTDAEKAIKEYVPGISFSTTIDVKAVAENAAAKAKRSQGIATVESLRLAGMDNERIEAVIIGTIDDPVVAHSVLLATGIREEEETTEETDE